MLARCEGNVFVSVCEHDVDVLWPTENQCDMYSCGNTAVSNIFGLLFVMQNNMKHVSPTSPSLPFPHASKLSSAHPHGQWNATSGRAKANIVARWICSVPVSSKLVWPNPGHIFSPPFLSLSDHNMRPSISSYEPFIPASHLSSFSAVSFWKQCLHNCAAVAILC
jgi:hypothetical protein